MADNIHHIDFTDALSERYLSYALSTIMSRSLPDVRDGLKPVHRRLLYAMQQLKLSPENAYKKCARVVGDVIGKYHPHGDTAVYDTLVRLAQSFSLRYPLIDGQGNFGSIDGDNAAAMRYTESRLTAIALNLMADLDKNTVDFRPTYDDSDEEPVLFPAGFPNLLANGSEGIAVGMATSVPPHNLDELCNALLHLVDNPAAEVQDLLQYVAGPDFPTGGTIIDTPAALLQIYETGRGSVRLQAKWIKEPLNHGLYQIVISEIPYQVQKSKLIEHIADLLKDKKLPLLSTIRDESAEDIRIVLEPKNRSCSAEMIMASLFKQTALEARISVNMNVLGADSVPKVMNLKQILVEFIKHRQNIVTKRSQFLLNKINVRLETLAGLKIAYLNLDEIIKIIREEDEPKPILRERFTLTDLQAEAILNMRLRSLRKLDELEIQSEHDKLVKEQKYLEGIIGDKAKCFALVKQEFLEIQQQFGKNTLLGARRTIFAEESDVPQIINIEAFVEREAITILCSKMGWIRSVKGHLTDLSTIKYKEGDEQEFVLHCYTTDQILLFTKFGRFYTVLADNIFKGKGDGEPIRVLINMENDDGIVSLHIYRLDEKFLVASTLGKGFIVEAKEVIAQTKLGKQILNISEGSAALACITVKGDKVATIGNNRKLLVFNLDEIPEMKRGQGVTLQKFKEGQLNDICLFDSTIGLSWQLGEKTRLEKDILPWLGRRGTAGKLPPVGFPKSNKFS